MKRRVHQLYYVAWIAAFLGLVLSAASLKDELPKPKFSPDSLMKHVQVLASDALEGRAAGTKGADSAAAYIEHQFVTCGLRAFPSGYRQEFWVPLALKLGKQNMLTYGTATQKPVKARLEKDFLPLGYSKSGAVSVKEVVFVGYGLSTEKYDDYRGVDVKGKAVVMMRQNPDGNNPHSEFYEASSLYRKLIVARDKGAAAVLIFSGAADFEDDAPIELTKDRLASDAGIVAVSITRTLAAALLNTDTENLARIQRHINETRQPKSFRIKKTLAISVELIREKAKTANVVGYLPATDSLVRDEYIVVGAHYDHLGYGGPGSGSLSPNEKAIHYGADDNASGTAALLELARYYSMQQNRPKRNLVFIAFGAEEMGLLGSAYFVQNPLFPLEQINLMLNMDMIGRMKDSTLAIGGVGTAAELSELVEAENRDGFKLKLTKDGYGPSDHSSFYSKGISVLFFFTGTHANYHKPSDTWEKLNYQAQARILEYIARIIDRVDQRVVRLTFTKAVSDSIRARASSGGFRVSLGTIPNYAKEVEGVELDGVREGSLAEKSGLKAGDVIVQFGERQIRNIYDYTEALRETKPGDVVKIVVKRDGKPISLTVEFPSKQ
ncbi:MAG: M20/M25/M40 family metallo-hydrolase [Chloroherpetonaceae bacterium]|nr:M20/M25/M40 family metallo-hydrolase [Chloroherpetonaceae bacterium]